MWIRYKLWHMISDQEKVHVETIFNHRYEFWKNSQGICDVQIKEHVDRLLNPRSMGSSNYELAYEKYDIFWDKEGRQVFPDSTSPVAPSEESVLSDDLSVTVSENESDSLESQKEIRTPRRKRGRPRKIRV